LPSANTPNPDFRRALHIDQMDAEGGAI
jgi:hypothetical protein